MRLDQFKTQVLLLHSEQSTLDSLSSGFGERYTVHCATSGTEALITLGETPINVIISAQDLPGMSGVEALREAKKRSPDTIGILLAGKIGRDIEALVGDEEVFQVVSGDVTGDGLRQLVDSATRQMRLMALAESANDMAANPDEPAEHIIMETSENGSTIITDATGRMPVLDPKRISAAAAVGSQAVDVLVMTKDQEFLATIKESSRGMHKVHYANTLKQADEAVRQHKVGVAVIDAAMVGDKVEQLTLHLRKGSARLVSIVAGRRDDGEMLMDLINRGKVYRFLLKPVSPGRARLAVEASIKHHLEAPDAAFQAVRSGQPAARPQPAAKPRPAPQPTAPAQSKPAATAAPRPTPKPPSQPAPRVAPQATKRPAPTRSDPPLGDPDMPSPVDEGLSAAFGGDDSSFTETMTGIIGAVGEKFSGSRKEPTTAESAGGSRSNKPLVLGVAAVVVVAIAGTLFWFMGNDAATDVQDEPAVAETAAPSVTEAAFGTPAADPAQVAVDVDETLAEAEAALLDSRLDDAEAALQRVAITDPDNARLPFLTAQLKQIQLRTYLAGARNAMRNTRFEDAANLIASARALGLSDTNEINAVDEELRIARSEQRVDEVLALANARLEEGDLLTPVNDNARYYFELVLSNAPDNRAARQGLNVVASRLVLQARAELDNGNLDAAEELLADAGAIDASSSELAATTTALIGARNAIAERARQAELERQAEIERQAELKRQADLERQREALRSAAERQAAAAKPDVDQSAAAPAIVEQAAEETTAPTATTVAPVAGPPAAQATVQEPEPASVDVADMVPVAVSSLTRNKYVAPKYPRAAERRGDSGWVDVVFTVALDGTVKDVEVRSSTPEGVFDRAAIRAVEKWEFEPVVENGVRVEKRAGVRMMFALE